MKAAIQFLSILFLIMCLHACAVNGFSRQKYTDFNHLGNLRMKGIKHADIRNTSPKEIEKKQSTVTLLPHHSIGSSGSDSIPEEKPAGTNAEKNAVTLKIDNRQLKHLSLNEVETASGRITQKIKKIHKKSVSRNRHKRFAAPGILAVILTGFALMVASSDKKTSDEKSLRLKKLLTILLLVTLGLSLLSGTSLIVGIFLNSFFGELGLFLGALAILTLLTAFVMFLCYKTRTNGARVWERKPFTDERLDQLDKRSRIFSWLGYFFLLLFVASVVMVFLLWEFILIPPLVLAVAVAFLIIAVISGRKYKKGCEETGVEYSRKAERRYIFNRVLVWLFGGLLILGSGFMGLLFIML